MASSGQTFRQVSHRVHRSRLMVCRAYGVMGMAATGQRWAQMVQPVQSAVTEYLISAEHFPAGQRPATWASYSSRK